MECVGCPQSNGTGKVSTEAAYHLLFCSDTLQKIDGYQRVGRLSM